MVLLRHQVSKSKGSDSIPNLVVELSDASMRPEKGGLGGLDSEDSGIAEYWRLGEKSKILTERLLLPSSCLEQWSMGPSTLLQRRKDSSGVCMGRLRPCCLAFRGIDCTTTKRGNDLAKDVHKYNYKKAAWTSFSETY